VLFPFPWQFAEKGTRIDDLKAIIERVTSVTTLFDRCDARHWHLPHIYMEVNVSMACCASPADQSRDAEMGPPLGQHAQQQGAGACGPVCGVAPRRCGLTPGSLPCSDGISLRAMNLPDQRDGVADSSQAAAYVQQLK
jgi:hypothetical protein